MFSDLPMADFYNFACNLDLSGTCQQRLDFFYDEVADETRAVSERRCAYLATVGPELADAGGRQPNADSIYLDRRFTLRADLVHSTSWFGGRMPVHIGHYEQVIAPTMRPSDSYAYIIVSAEWKNVLERFDPGTHEFFPHTLRFIDGYIRDRYIFRSQGYLRKCYGADFKRYYYLLKQNGRHWMNENYFELGLGSIISRALAVELHNLLTNDEWIYVDPDGEALQTLFTPISEGDPACVLA
jgi:hypothetical protein